MKKTYIFDVAFVKKENNDDPFEEKPRNKVSNDIVIISGHSLIEKKYFYEVTNNKPCWNVPSTCVKNLSSLEIKKKNNYFFYKKK